MAHEHEHAHCNRYNPDSLYFHTHEHNGDDIHTSYPPNTLHEHSEEVRRYGHRYLVSSGEKLTHGEEKWLWI